MLVEATPRNIMHKLALAKAKKVLVAANHFVEA